MNNKMYPPADTPVRVHWVLPSDFTEETAGQFVEEARRIVKHPEWSTVVRDHNQKDYLCIDIADVSFPGFLKGDQLDNGQPARNDYVVTLSKRAAVLVGLFMQLLRLYGAETDWEPA